MKMKKLSLNSNEYGFTMTETLVSIALTLILSASLCILLTTVLLNKKKGSSKLLDTISIVKTDFLIREKISKTTFPYWIDSTKLASYFSVSLTDELSSKGISIISTQILRGRNGDVRGLSIQYKLHNDSAISQTDCCFASIPVVGIK